MKNSGSVDFSKFLIILLLVANIGGLGYNLWRWYERYEEGDVAAMSADGVLGIKKDIVGYTAEMERIGKENIIAVDDELVYFRDQALKVWPNPDQVWVFSGKPESNKSKGFLEERWKLNAAKNQRFKMQDIARFCQLIEQGAPQFQIKEVDLGKRSETWGNDEWAAQWIMVRRVTRVEGSK